MSDATHIHRDSQSQQPASALPLVVSPDRSNDKHYHHGTTSSSFASACPPHCQTMLEKLCRLLGIVAEQDTSILSTFLTQQQIASLDDLGFLEQTDIPNDLSPIAQRKLWLLMNVLQKGGSLDMIETLPQLRKAAQSLQQPPQAPPNTTNQDVPSQTENPHNNNGGTDVIELNVGGKHFTTTRKTLCRFPDTMLGRMFSGRHDASLPRVGHTYVIDRNGDGFGYILDYLRVGGVVSLPASDADKKALALEADYYGLDELATATRMPTVDVADHLDEETLQFRQLEDKARHVFMVQEETNTDSDNLKGWGPHQGLVSVFDDMDELPLRYEPLYVMSRKSMLMDLRKQSRTGAAVTVESLEVFQTNFNRDFPNVLHRLEDVLLQEPVIVAGGSVLRALTGQDTRTSRWWGGDSARTKSDVDLFIHGTSASEATRIAKRIFYAMSADHERWCVMRGRGVITMHNWTGAGWDWEVNQKIQIVLRLYDSPAEVLFGFDVDCCCVCYDGRKVWATSRALYALKRGFNTLNPLHHWPNKASYELRLAKYTRRGFPVVVPGLDKGRLDHDRIQHSKLKDLMGMGRLIKISYEMEANKGLDNNKRDFDSQPIEKVTSLKPSVQRDVRDTDFIIHGMSGYDEDVDVVVSDVYGGTLGEILGNLWWGYLGQVEHHFPLAQEIRDRAWDAVEEAEDTPPRGIPSKLDDAWDTSKRSREYLNAHEMSKFDLDNVYYNHAYQNKTTRRLLEELCLS